MKMKPPLLIAGLVLLWPLALSAQLLNQPGQTGVPPIDGPPAGRAGGPTPVQAPAETSSEELPSASVPDQTPSTPIETANEPIVDAPAPAESWVEKVNGDFGLDSPPLVTGATASGGPAGEQRITWDGNAISVILPVGVERKVVFPQAIAELKLDPGIAPAKLSTTPLSDVVLWKALEPFETTRVLVNDSTGMAYALDLSAVETTIPAIPLVIEFPQARQPRHRGPSRPHIPVHTVDPHRYSYRALTQFAAQQLYAPERLIQSVPGVVLSDVVREPVRLLRYGEFTATPVASWQAPGLYVTAVKLVNNLNRAVTFDPRKLIGRWLTATPQFTQVAPKGQGADTTAVYLLSKQPFAEALGLWNRAWNLPPSSNARERDRNGPDGYQGGYPGLSGLGMSDQGRS